MRQILLITDGCSNTGISPVIAASQAAAEQIAVNVIGVVERNENGDFGTQEVHEIAEAGGGMSRIVHVGMLAQTVQMMTRKTVMSTVQQTVNRQLRDIFGKETSLDKLPPDQREQVVRVMDNVEDTIPLQIALLVDTSASMKPKLAAVEHAVHDLMLSLQARGGKSELAVFHFPSMSPGGKESAHLLRDWTTDLAKMNQLFYKIDLKGTTPTGPALLEVVRFMGRQRSHTDGHAPRQELPPKDGIMSDYVV
jgi:Ca-activated chloride channel homolog